MWLILIFYMENSFLIIYSFSSLNVVQINVKLFVVAFVLVLFVCLFVCFCFYYFFPNFQARISAERTSTGPKKTMNVRYEGLVGFHQMETSQWKDLYTHMQKLFGRAFPYFFPRCIAHSVSYTKCAVHVQWNSFRPSFLQGAQSLWSASTYS